MTKRCRNRDPTAVWKWRPFGARPIRKQNNQNSNPMGFLHAERQLATMTIEDTMQYSKLTGENHWKIFCLFSSIPKLRPPIVMFCKFEGGLSEPFAWPPWFPPWRAGDGFTGLSGMTRDDYKIPRELGQQRRCAQSAWWRIRCGNGATEKMSNIFAQHSNLVGGLDHFFVYIGNNPNWQIFFREVATTNQ